MSKEKNMSLLPNALTARISRVQGTAARALVHLPAAAQHALARAMGYRNPHANLDPHVQVLLAVRQLQGAGQLLGKNTEKSRRHFRQQMASISGMPTAVGSVRDFHINGPAGLIGVRHYVPAGQHDALPLLVFYHGGGFIVGDLDTHDEPCRILCAQGNMQVLSVDYRLAPEHKAPAAVDDCVAALRWAHDHATALKVDPRKIGVGGDSAGGNLSAVVSQITAGTSHAPAAQLLIYPVVDLVDVYASHQTYSAGLFLSQADMDQAKASYVQHSGVPLNDARISPLRGTLSGLAAALVVTAGHDVLRDEGELYAERLKAAGTRCTLERVVSQGHGFMNISSINPTAKAATVKMAKDFRALLDQVGR
jgi:acetyl esterase